jgi:hypothetical protein
MDWARAVEINRMALTRIVAELLAMVGFVSTAALERLLRPTESALRRLIVVAAHGLIIMPAAKRAMPKGLVIANKGNSKISFRLFDKRKSFDFSAAENPFLVNVHTYQNNPFNLFNSRIQPKLEKQNGNLILSRRLQAIVHALKTLPHQAKRLARWKLQRKKLENPKFTSPLRPGPPPGHRAKPTAEVDFVLRECHALAFDALKQDSS